MPLVIFVDDCRTILALTRISTSSMPIEIKQYAHAEVALAEIKAGMTPDLIITDLNMPVMNGFEFLQGLRALESTKKTPCLMLTSETETEVKQQGKELGLLGWIVKPFNPAQLNKTIASVLGLPTP